MYFLWTKKSKWKQPLNISENGFYKQVLDFHRPSKILCRTFGRQNHWYLYSIFRRFISILCVCNSHIDNIKNLLTRITKYTSAVQKEHEMLRKRIIIEYRSFFVSVNSVCCKCRCRRVGHHHIQSEFVQNFSIKNTHIYRKQKNNFYSRRNTIYYFCIKGNNCTCSATAPVSYPTFIEELPQWPSGPSLVTPAAESHRLPKSDQTVSYSLQFLFNYRHRLTKMHKAVEAWKQKKIHK